MAGAPAVLVFTPLDPETAPFRLARVDEQGRPTATTVLSSTATAAARVGDRIFLFSRGGVAVVRERAPGSSDGEWFEIDRFYEHPPDREFDGAAAGGEVAVLCGRTELGDVVVETYDGASFHRAEIASEGRPGAAQETAVCALDGGRFLVVVREAAGLVTGVCAADRVQWLGRSALPQDSRGLAVTRDSRGAVAAWSIAPGPGGDPALWVARIDADHPPFQAEPAAVLADCSAARLVGALAAPAVADEPAFLVDLDGRIATLVPGRTPPEAEAPAALLAWTSFWRHFGMCVSLHMLLLFGVATIGRALRLRRVAAGAPAVQQTPAEPVPAGLLRRIAAFLIDLGISLVATMAIYSTTIDSTAMEYFSLAAESGDPVRFWSAGLGAMDPIQASFLMDSGDIFLIVVTALFVLCEAFWGRSPGKALLGLRVVARDGAPVSLDAAATRGVMLYLDFFWYNGLIGLALVVFTRRRQRLGDLLARTMVVRNDVRSEPAPPGAGRPPADQRPV